MKIPDNYREEWQNEVSRTYHNKERVDLNITTKVIDFRAKWITFRNKDFKSGFKIENTNLNIGLRFENCTFTEAPLFYNIRAEGYDEEFSLDSENLVFLKCGFNKGIQFAGMATSIERDIKFEECTFGSAIFLNNVHISLQRLVFNNCDLQGNLHIEGCKINGGISISNSLIQSQVRISNGRVGGIDLNNSRCSRDFQVFATVIEKYFSVSGGEYSDTVILDCIGGDKCALSLNGGEYKDAFKVKYQNKTNDLQQGFKSLYFDSCEFNNGFFAEGIEHENIHAERPLVESIEINTSSKMKGDISFSYLHVGDISIKGINTYSNLKFEHVRVNHLNISYFYNSGQVLFLGVVASDRKWYWEDDEADQHEIGNTIYITHSDLGKTYFFATDFSSFESLDIADSNLTEVVFSNVTWFDPKKLGILKEAEWVAGYKKKITDGSILFREYLSRREVFRQLKYVCEKQGDKLQSLIFSRWEMTIYNRYLKLAKDKTREERFIFWVSQTNNFGESWTKAAWIGLLVTYILFMPIGLLASERLIPFTFAKSWDDVWFTIKEIGYYQFPNYTQLLNPAHLLDRIYPGINTRPQIVFVLDAIHRLFTTFFIFQIVSAFRRYIKN